jgi:hypothetical protein
VVLVNDHDRSLLTTALSFLSVKWQDERPPVVDVLHAYADSWDGLGRLATTMWRDGYAFNLTTVDAEMWRATLDRHPMQSATGSEPRPSRGSPCSARRGWRSRPKAG